jgi:hypothetical protein
VAFKLEAGKWALRAHRVAATHFLSVIRGRIQGALMGERRVVELVPQKINVYEAGGFFAEHVDTTDPLASHSCTCWRKSTKRAQKVR